MVSPKKRLIRFTAIKDNFPSRAYVKVSENAGTGADIVPLGQLELIWIESALMPPPLSPTNADAMAALAHCPVCWAG